MCCAAVTVRALGDWVRVSAWIQCNWREAECAIVSTALPVNRRDAPDLLLRAKEAQARPTDRCGPLPGAVGRVGQVSADEGVGRFLPFYSIDSVFRCTNILNCMKSDMSISLSFSVLCHVRKSLPSQCREVPLLCFLLGLTFRLLARWVHFVWF